MRLVYIILLTFYGCAPVPKTCEGIEASRCLRTLPVCERDLSSYACRVSLLNEYCKLAIERLACASRALKVTVPECNNDRDISHRCTLATKTVLSDIVKGCVGLNKQPQACQWLTKPDKSTPQPRTNANISVIDVPTVRETKKANRSNAEEWFEDKSSDSKRVGDSDSNVTSPVNSTSSSSSIGSNETSTSGTRREDKYEKMLKDSLDIPGDDTES